MADIYMTVVQALRAHWQAHNNAYPQKILLTPSQADALLQLQTIGMVPFPDAKIAPSVERFMNVPIEITTDTTGELQTVDGQRQPLHAPDH